MLYRFNDLTRPFLFRAADPVLASVRQTLFGWRIRKWTGPPRTPPAANVRKTLRGWGLGSDRYTPMNIFPDMADVVCDFVAELSRQYRDDLTGHLFMHCAGVRIGDGLVIFPSTYRAGKSVLTCYLAMRGHRVWCDDIIPLLSDSYEAIAAGYAPRLRFPLPEDAPAEFASYVDDHLVLRGRKYGYIDPGTRLLARHGERARIRGVVMLQRAEEKVKPAMDRVTKGLAMRYAINRNFSYHLHGTDMIQAFIAALDDAPCYRVTYNRVADAADLIFDKFDR